MQAWLYAHVRGLLLALVAAALAWLAGTWLAQPAGERGEGQPWATHAAVQVPAPARPSNGAVAATRNSLDIDRPAGVTREQWLALQEEMRSRPDGAAELRRIADYLDWSDLLRGWREPRSDLSEQLRLARAIDAGLPARMRQGEVSAAEARQIKSAILEVTLPDPAERAAALQRWISAQTGAVQPDPRQAEFERRQSAIVSGWAAQPAGLRDGAALERELESLRGQVFGAPAPAPR